MSLKSRLESLKDQDLTIITAQRRADAELIAMADKVRTATNTYNTQLTKAGNDYSLSKLVVLKSSQNILVDQYAAMQALYKTEFEDAPKQLIEKV